MTNTNDIPQSQPTDLVARFEPARAVCAPKACYRGKLCWVTTGKIRGSNYTTCFSCQGTPTFAGNEAAHMAVLRRCMAAQEVKP